METRRNRSDISRSEVSTQAVKAVAPRSGWIRCAEFLRLAAVMLILAAVLAGCGKSKAKQVEEQLELGAKYLSEMNYEEAIVVLQKAIELDPKELKAYENMAAVYMAMEDPQKAVDILDNGIEIYQSMSANEQEKVRALYEALMKAKGEGHYTMAADYLAEEQIDEAIEQYLEAIAADPSAPDPYMELADIYIQEKQWDRAIEILQQGYENTGNEDIKQKMDNIVQGDDEVVWDDSAFESMVRQAIGIPDGPVYVRDLDRYKDLIILGNTHSRADEEFVDHDYSWRHVSYIDGGIGELMAFYGVGDEEFTERGQIVSVKALRYFRNLESVAVIANHITDISVLKDMQIANANFWGNDIADTSELASRFDSAVEQFVEIGSPIQAQNQGD